MPGRAVHAFFVFRSLSPLLVAATVVALSAWSPLRAQVVPAAMAKDETRDDPTSLPVFEVNELSAVQEFFDEDVEIPFPFRGQSGLFGAILLDEEASREDLAMVGDQVAALADFNPREFATASGAEAPRGFTTPRLRNGLNQSGFPEIIVGGRRELLTGFMATYHGRTAPGGIQNTLSHRPTPKPLNAFSFGLAAGDGTQARFGGEHNATLQPKRLHYRAVFDARGQDGPQDFAREVSAKAGLGLRYAPTKGTVWLVEIEGARVDATPAGGIVLGRATQGAPQGGPHRPLAHFNTNGPRAWTERTSGSVSVLLEQKAQEDLRLRVGAQVWRRTQEELRFNTSAYLVGAGVFDGVREPQYNALEQSALGLEVELTGTGQLPIGNHEWLVGAFASRDQTDRDQRALPIEARDALPATVRTLDPSAPDWSLPAYSPDVYARVLAARDEGADYAGVFVSERVALPGNRVFGTIGARNDWVNSQVNDRADGAAVPHAGAQVSRTTHHAGIVWHTIPNRLAGFVNRSTAFQPVRRVDARTGRIVGNESTSGLEWGWRYATSDGKSTLTLSTYRLWNENITRNNPLYNDPVFDAESRQPQLVSSGEERFTGSELGLRTKASPSLTFTGKVAWVEAITTESPDLPQEIGRQLPRLPQFTAGGNLRYVFRAPGLQGLTLGAGYAWIGEHIAVYETARRLEVAYDDYGVIDLSAGVVWQSEQVEHALNLAVRNTLNVDLVAAAGRLGGARALDAGYSLRF